MSEEKEEGESRAIVHFLNDLDSLIDRYRLEYDLTYAACIGCLEIAKYVIMSEVEKDDEA